MRWRRRRREESEPQEPEVDARTMMVLEKLNLAAKNFDERLVYIDRMLRFMEERPRHGSSRDHGRDG